MIKTIKSKSGTYVFTDPCYVVARDNWDEVCDVFDFNNPLKEQIIQLSNNTVIQLAGTKYGDGCYKIENVHNKTLGYACVDAGLLGIIAIEDISPEKDYSLVEFGITFKSDSEIYLKAENGVFTVFNVEGKLILTCDTANNDRRKYEVIF